ncbi:Helitron helicase-like protein [Phytophthora palmivora]|uniref:Helitron helicase-like protein n=1 Tax=Phytophthora palmivora TaxID=4796 RepID=A0A2P4X098_9STRA|nr:Helitron helicase-like protein [Phytophthora palmivora]
MTGDRRGQHVLIPGDDAIVFLFRLWCKQFVVQLTFAMTINNAQGQTAPHLGLYLATSCFSHGQVYVALSGV